MSNHSQPHNQNNDIDRNNGNTAKRSDQSQANSLQMKDPEKRIEMLFSGISAPPVDPNAPQTKEISLNDATNHVEERKSLRSDPLWQSNPYPHNSLSWESLLQGKPKTDTSNEGKPSVLAYGHRMSKNILDQGKETALLMEFLDEKSDRVWTGEEVQLVEHVADQLTLALENARLFQETQNALTETESLYQASADLNACLDYQDILAALRQHTFLGLADRLVSISIFDQPWTDQLTPTWITPLAHWTCLPEENFQPRYMVEKFPAASYLSPTQAALFDDLEHDPRLDHNAKKLFQKNFQSESAIFIPLNIGGKWIGFILGSFSQPQVFIESQVRRLMALSKQASVAIQNLRLLAESQRRANQLQTAAEIARDTSSTLALDDLFSRFVNLLCERFGYYHASIFLIDEAKEYAVVRESTGKAGEALKQKGHKLAIGSRSIIGQATLTGYPVVLNDLSTREARETHYANPLLPHTKAELGIPLKIGDRVIGALNVQSKQPNAFSEDDVSILQTLADQIAVAIDNAQAYQMVQQAMEESRKADQLKSQFLANMSHELRTPLNSIIGFSRVILKGIDGPINTLQQQDLTAIYNSGQHLLGLINDVLDLSKIEAGKMELSFEDGVNINEIINGVMSTATGLVKDKPISLYHTVDPEIPALRIDPIKIRQVLLNLISNAAKFTDDGSISVEVKVEQSLSGDKEVKVCVMDTGVGISKEDQSKLFQPFSQVDGSLTRKTGGSGLGLSICQHLIKMHQGRIGLDSEPGKGSTFYFYLPIHCESPSAENNIVSSELVQE